jgi:glycosyltransferase involved in cell wall biosynthesis
MAAIIGAGGGDLMTVASAVKGLLKERVGYMRLMDIKTKTLFGWQAIGARRFENEEVARLSAVVVGRPRARVATIMPTFRRPELLRAALESVLSQTVGDQVVVVVDDGGGVDLDCDDPRVHVVSLSRNTRTPGLCRNVGMRLTDSDFVAFLDDDNEWEPNHLEVALRELEAGRDLVFTALTRRRADGSAYDVLSHEFDRAAMARDQTQADTSAIVVRRSAGTFFSRIRRGAGRYPIEDWEFVFRLSRRITPVHVPVATVNYRVSSESFFTEWGDEQCPR